MIQVSWINAYYDYIYILTWQTDWRSVPYHISFLKWFYDFSNKKTQSMNNLFLSHPFQILRRNYRANFLIKTSDRFAATLSSYRHLRTVLKLFAVTTVNRATTRVVSHLTPCHPTSNFIFHPPVEGPLPVRRKACRWPENINFKYRRTPKNSPRSSLCTTLFAQGWGFRGKLCLKAPFLWVQVGELGRTPVRR